ncbi:MAG TPA: hypothetical protein VGQ39_04355 [Pyrinomonadaceae bacterium]|jgi:hypothetical protein|nr:hypothetical protein [Pyrinomonadaceae bacterium]
MMRIDDDYIINYNKFVIHLKKSRWNVDRECSGGLCKKSENPTDGRDSVKTQATAETTTALTTKLPCLSSDKQITR